MASSSSSSSSFSPRRPLPSPEHQNLRPNHPNINNNSNNLMMMTKPQKTTRPQWTVTMNPSQCLFQSVAERNYSTLMQLFAHNARNSVVSYLAMKRHRWGGGRTMNVDSNGIMSDHGSSRASGGGSFSGGSVQAGTYLGVVVVFCFCCSFTWLCCREEEELLVEASLF